MDYREHPLPETLRPWVRAIWTMQCSGDHLTWVDHDAVPDGCLEFIHRLQGESDWNGAQPSLIAAGVATRRASLRLSANYRCLGIRLWPWSWVALGGVKPSLFADRWIDELPRSLASHRAENPEQAIELALTIFAEVRPPVFVPAIFESLTVGELANRSGISVRGLQRYFSDQIGISPKAFIRLMRFEQSFLRLQRDSRPIADHAAEGGYADQAHMARDFRRLAGERTVLARRRAKGPFL